MTLPFIKLFQQQKKSIIFLWFITPPPFPLETFLVIYGSLRASLVAQRVKRLPAMRETWVRSQGWEGPMEKEMATHFSTLAWKIPWTEEPDRLQSMGLQRVGHNWATSLLLFTFHFHALEKEMATHSSVHAWRIPGMGEPGGLPSMGRTESDTTEAT